MTKDELVEAAKDNWYFLLALVALIPAGIFAARAGSPDVEAENLATQQAVSAALAASAQSGDVASFNRGGRTAADEAMGHIKGYEKEVAENWSSDETPLNLRRIGNLYYTSLRDYDKAVENYELIIYRFPEWDGIDSFYPNLAMAYKRLGNTAMERQTYQRMIKHFPPESNYVEFAQHQLKLTR